MAVNNKLLAWLGYNIEEVQGQHIDVILTGSSRLFYQMYILPMLRMQGEIEEVYFPLLSFKEIEVPVLINAISREIKEDGSFTNDMVVMRMKTRHKLEDELLSAKKEADEAVLMMTKSVAELEEVKAELQKLNADLESLAITDSLTGLKNRRYFEQTLNSSISQFSRLKDPLSLILIDIDFFKKINDQWGHATGDIVLQHIAIMMKTSFRGTDTVARFGGEEFAVILPGIDSDVARDLGENLRANVEITPLVEQWVTVSIGVTSMITGDSFQSLFKRADAALYSSKTKGRNRVSYY